MSNNSVLISFCLFNKTFGIWRMISLLGHNKIDGRKYQIFSIHFLLKEKKLREMEFLRIEKKTRSVWRKGPILVDMNVERDRDKVSSLFGLCVRIMCGAAVKSGNAEERRNRAFVFVRASSAGCPVLWERFSCATQYNKFRRPHSNTFHPRVAVAPLLCFISSYAPWPHFSSIFWYADTRPGI